MQNFFNDIYTYQAEGRDVDWLVLSLLKLADAHFTYVDITSGTIVPAASGAQRLSDRLNNQWGTSLTVTTVSEWLTNHGLPAP